MCSKCMCVNHRFLVYLDWYSIYSTDMVPRFRYLKIMTITYKVYIHIKYNINKYKFLF